jgi:membrane protein implicated in regulation of membrane protease activity
MKKRYWLLLLLIIGIAIWFMPLPQWIIESVIWSCIVISLVIIYRAVIARTDIGEKRRRQVKRKKVKQTITVDQDGIKWGDARW